MPSNPIASGGTYTVSAGQSRSLTSLFTYSDADGDIVAFAVRDRELGGGYLTRDGVRMTETQLFDNIPIGEIGRWAFVAGPTGSTSTVGFNAIDSRGAFNSSAVATLNVPTVTDSTSPMITSFSPSDNSSEVAVSANLVINFNETVRAGSGNVFIFNSNGTLFRTISVTDTSQVSFSGSTMTVNPSVNLNAGSSYYVQLSSGAVRDTAGNNHSGITSTTVFNFSTAIGAVDPIASGGSYSVAAGASRSIASLFTYSDANNDIVAFAVRDRELGGGYLTRDGVRMAENQLFDNIPISEIGRWAFVAGPSGSTSTVGFNAIDSRGGFNPSALATITVPTVTDTVAPVISSFSPADGSTGVAVGANLVLTFNEAVRAGTGNVVIYNSSGTAVRTISVTDTSQVTFSGSTMTINPTADLAAGTSYYVQMVSGVVRDTAGNNFAGITTNTQFNFTTASGTTDDGGSILNAAVAYLGDAWGLYNCTGFVFTVAYDTGNVFFDSRTATPSYNGAFGNSGTVLLNNGQGNDYGYVVPVRDRENWPSAGTPATNPDPAFDNWSIVGEGGTANLTASTFRGFQPGDLFRGLVHFNNGTSVVHSGVVAAYDQSSGRIWLIDNVTSTGSAAQISYTEFAVGATTGRRFDLAAMAIYRLDDAFIDTNDSITGSGLTDILGGGSGNDTISGGAGNDRLWGNAGSDTFVFRPGHGNDRVNDFENGLDKLWIRGLSNGFSSLSVQTDGLDTLVNFGADSIRLVGVNASLIEATDFIFT